MTITRNEGQHASAVEMAAPAAVASADGNIVNPLAEPTAAAAFASTPQAASFRVFVYPNVYPRAAARRRKKSSSKGSVGDGSGGHRGRASEEDVMRAHFNDIGRVVIVTPEMTLSVFLEVASRKLKLKHGSRRAFLEQGKQGIPLSGLDRLKAGDRIFVARYSDSRFFRDRPSSLRFQYVLFGATGVGKTALLKRFVTGRFVSFHDPSIEEQTVVVRNVNKCPCSMSVLDTGGAREFVDMSLGRWTQRIHGAILVYDMSNLNTLQALDVYVDHLHSAAFEAKTSNSDSGGRGNGGGGDGSRPLALSVPSLLVGTKADVLQYAGNGNGAASGKASKKLYRAAEKAGQEYADRYGMHFVAASAKTGGGVDKSFFLITEMVLGQLGGGELELAQRLRKEHHSRKRLGFGRSHSMQSGGCCGCLCAISQPGT